MTDPTKRSHLTGPTHRVRPRWTWAGLATMVVGLALAGAGVVLLSWPWAVVGAVVLAVGAAAGLRGGLLYDTTRHGSAGDLAADVVHGRQVQAPGPDAHYTGPTIREDVEETEAERRTALAGQPGLRASLAPVGGVALAAASVWLFVSQMLVYPQTGGGETGTWRALAGAVVVGLCALRILLVGRARLAALVALLTGDLLVLGAVFVAGGGAAVSEAAAGVAVVLGAVLALDPRARRLGPTAS
ncbi:hypothetical protein [Nocardioides donggukensis]|uniref:Uncharacterized protein n=1 Tax=Nocardioides donggukensis TaxID=2774019 RepID=A0A927K5E8_9ACTN|nr:hypothetical protein [Nocardioides donggukensis]MBD8870574.1 hypothetical protein [Nocardioides donggukensis]